MAKLEKSLRACLSRAKSERPLQRWLEQNPLVLSASVEGLAYPNHVVSQFKFGTDFVADFVAFGAFSGACCVHIIELEPPDAPLFTKAGVPAKRLNRALAQIAAWKAFVEKHREPVLRELAKVLKKRDLVWGKNASEPTDTTGMPLYDPDQWLIWEYHVVIGRRADLSKSDLGKKAAYFTQAKVDVMTYDRLLDRATLLDGSSEHAALFRPGLMAGPKNL